MSKAGKITAAISGAFLLLIVVAIILIATFDWNRLKPTINQKVSAELNRPFAIRGDLGVVWERQKQETGWRSWVPWPHIHAEDIILGNPPDIPEVTMVHLPRVEATLAPLALLTKTVWLPWIKLEKPDARLIRLSEKNNNWTFNLANDGNKDANAKPSAWSFRLDNILFDQGRIAIDDKVSKADLEIFVDPLGKPLPFSEVTGSKGKADKEKVGDYVFGLKAQGRYNGEPLTGTGKIGGMLALRGEGTPFPVQADFRSGNTRVAFDGVVNDPMKMGGVDLRLKFSGDSLGDLYELTGVLLPDTPPFETDGRLVAKIDTEKSSVFDYRGFNGRIGDSDIHGSLVYTTGKPRPKLEGDVESRQLRLADLGPLIGVDSGKGAEKSKRSEQKKGEKSVQPAGKVLPYDRFETDKWDVMGMGKSGHIGRKMAATFASTGTPSFFVHPGEAAHGDLGMVTPQDVVIAISNSGESSEITALIPVLKRLHVPLICITGRPESSMARAADVHLCVKVAKEACPLGLAPTSSTTATLVMGDALAVALLKARGFTAEDFALSHPGGALGRKLLLRVNDIMHTGDEIPHVKKTASLRDALLEVTRKNLGMTVICDDNMMIEGIFTDGDLRRVFDMGVDVRQLSIADVMTPGGIRVRPGILAVEALNLMQSRHITSVMVADGDHLLGVLHMHDLLRAGVV